MKQIWEKEKGVPSLCSRWFCYLLSCFLVDPWHEILSIQKSFNMSHNYSKYMCLQACVCERGRSKQSAFLRTHLLINMYDRISHQIHLAQTDNTWCVFPISIVSKNICFLATNIQGQMQYHFQQGTYFLIFLLCVWPIHSLGIDSNQILVCSQFKSRRHRPSNKTGMPIDENQSKDIHTIHEPSTIRGDVSLGNNEVKICQDLHNFQQNSWFVDTVNLQSFSMSLMVILIRRELGK